MQNKIYPGDVTGSPAGAPDKVLVGLSGGVDSSTSVQLLREQGFDVTAAFIRFSPAHDAAAEKAREVADQLNVPFYVLDAGEDFEREVVAPFCAAYCRGRTPSPCVMCNPLVKFKTLCDAADAMHIPYIATGHYARVERDGAFYYIHTASSSERDQSYMLYRLPQSILQRLVLPTGDYDKANIREKARGLHLASADAPDSMEICFIPDGDYAGFIAARGLACKQGRFIGPKGEDLGAHKGVMYYTVGQRKGLQIAYGEPVFVQRILENGDIQLALTGGEFYNGVKLENVVCADTFGYRKGESYLVKIRSRATPAPCHIAEAPDGTHLTVSFDAPLRAPAPGQSAVLYRGDLVVGGGEICEMF